MATDTLARHGQEPASLDDEHCRPSMPSSRTSGAGGNPIDILGDASAERFDRALTICFNSKTWTGCWSSLRPGPDRPPFRSRDPGRRDPATPVSGICLLDGRQTHRHGRGRVEYRGIPTYDTPERRSGRFYIWPNIPEILKCCWKSHRKWPGIWRLIRKRPAG